MRRRTVGGSAFFAIIIVIFTLLRYCSSRTVNEVTGSVEYVSMSPQQEIEMGLNTRDQVAAQYGGYYPDKQVQHYVDSIGHVVVSHSDAARSPYEFDFYVLNDPQTVNAFALPGGQIFITKGLLDRLSTEDELAGVLGHEIGHVIERHSSERIAKSQLYQGLGGAAVVATGSANVQDIAYMVISSSLMANSRKDELEADDLGVKYMMQANYDPHGMIQVMEVLKDAGGGSQPEFTSTHPNPGHREQEIEKSIDKYEQVLPNEGQGSGADY